MNLSYITRYSNKTAWLDDAGFDSGPEWIVFLFSKNPRQLWAPIQSPIELTPWLLTGGKAAEMWKWLPTSISVEIKITRSCANRVFSEFLSIHKVWALITLCIHLVSYILACIYLHICLISFLTQNTPWNVQYSNRILCGKWLIEMELFGLRTCVVLYKCRKYGYVQTGLLCGGLWGIWRKRFNTKQVE